MKNCYSLLFYRTAMQSNSINVLRCFQELETSGSIKVLIYSPMVFSFILIIYVYCHLGEVVTDQVLKIIRTLYNNITNPVIYNQLTRSMISVLQHIQQMQQDKLVQHAKKVALKLIMIMAIAENPIHLTAGKVILF